MDEACRNFDDEPVLAPLWNSADRVGLARLNAWTQSVCEWRTEVGFSQTTLSTRMTIRLQRCHGRRPATTANERDLERLPETRSAAWAALDGMSQAEASLTHGRGLPGRLSAVR